MKNSIKSFNSKEIISLDIFDAVRLRPGMYIGNISPIIEKKPIIENRILIQKDKNHSIGFNHLIVEIFENALDEAKRMRGKMKEITVSVNFDNNQIIISDTGLGFHKANSKHPKTKKNVVRTAFEEIHAGSNFLDSSTNLLGTFGVGASIVNILSQNFEVTTINGTSYVHYEWKDYKVVNEDKRKKETTENRGTTVSFIPSPEVFPNYEWDEELIRTYLSFKSYLISIDPQLKKLKLNAQFVRNGVSEDAGIVENFLPDQHIAIKNTLGTIILWKSYDQSCSVSFVNGSQCTGIHQKIVNDWGNTHFGYNLAHHFYDTVVALDVPSTLMRFGDQNKSKYDVTRFEIEEIMETNFKSKLIRGLKNSPITKEIEADIEEKLYAENIRKIKKAQRTSKRKISHKYSPASRKKDYLYITEGLCIEENQKIFVLKSNKLQYIKIKDAKIGDLVLTHENRFRPIIHKNKNIKNISKIHTPEGILECSIDHRWLIYDIINKEFRFIRTKELDINNHKLVKNYLVFLESFDEIISKDIEDEKIVITNNKKEKWDITIGNAICFFDESSESFKMKSANDLKEGDLIAKFDNPFEQ